MNGRKAKQLRNQAKDATVGAPPVEYQPQRQIAKSVRVPNDDPRSYSPWKMLPYYVETERRLTATCTRGVYQSLKRGKPTKAIEFTGRRQTRAERQRAERDNVTLVGA